MLRPIYYCCWSAPPTRNILMYSAACISLIPSFRRGRYMPIFWGYCVSRLGLRRDSDNVFNQLKSSNTKQKKNNHTNDKENESVNILQIWIYEHIWSMESINMVGLTQKTKTVKLTINHITPWSGLSSRDRSITNQRNTNDLIKTTFLMIIANITENHLILTWHISQTTTQI